MDYITILILVLSFFTLLAMGVPVAFCLGLSTTFTIAVNPNIELLPAITTVCQQMTTGIDSFALLAIPFFVLAGELMNQGGIATRLIDFARAMVGRLPGGLANVNVMGAMLFGAVSGSAVAAATAIGGIMTDRMKEEGYPKPFSASVNITASTTGLLIPPSNVLIIYALASGGGASVAALFMAGYIPGILVGLGLMAVAVWISISKKFPKGEGSSLQEIIQSFGRAFLSLMLLVVVVGGIVKSVFTATEGAAIAVLYALLLALSYKQLKVKHLPSVLLNSVKTTAMVMFLVATSMAMSWLFSFEEIPQAITDFFLGLTDNKIVILLMINLILLVVGTFMDMTPAVLIFTPIFLPVVTALGMDPVHFGIVMVLNLCIGLCTPPVGTLLFVGSAVAKIKVTNVIRPLIPFMLAMVIALVLITYIPSLSLWLPGLFDLLK